MKLASFHYRGRDAIGVMSGAGKLACIDGVSSMLELIGMAADGMTLVESALRSGTRIDCGDVAWQPPVRPGKICGVAMNNSASNARKISAPDHPAFFLKPASCLIGHGEAIRVRPYYGSVHPEPELAVVIGRMTRDIDAVDALEAVYGYSIFNDVTGNGMRAEDLFHYWALYADPNDPDALLRREQHLSYAARYKGTDTFGAMGPFIVSPDEIDDPDDLAVRCRVNGAIIAEDSTRYYNYKVAELISFLSQFLTLEPGDVISCGTAFKASRERKSIHQTNFQVVAGPVEISIDGLGTLINPVEIEDRTLGDWRLRRSDER